MSERPIANEAACPIPLERLAAMLRAGPREQEALVLALPEGQRAAFALFCYHRQHLRDLSFSIARHCEARLLVRAGGTVGIVLYDQSREMQTPADTQPRTRVKGVSLAKRA